MWEGGSGDLEGTGCEASSMQAMLYFLTSPRVIPYHYHGSSFYNNWFKLRDVSYIFQHTNYISQIIRLAKIF